MGNRVCTAARVHRQRIYVQVEEKGEPVWLRYQTPDALRAFQKNEADKWWPIIKAANIKPQ